MVQQNTVILEGRGKKKASYCNLDYSVGKKANYSSFLEKVVKLYLVLCYLTCDILPTLFVFLLQIGHKTDIMRYYKDFRVLFALGSHFPDFFFAIIIF